VQVTVHAHDDYVRFMLRRDGVRMPRPTIRPAPPAASPTSPRTPRSTLVSTPKAAPDAVAAAAADAGRRLEETVAREGQRIHRAARRPR
jgi:hypothetical protein